MFGGGRKLSRFGRRARGERSGFQGSFECGHGFSTSAGGSILAVASAVAALARLGGEEIAGGELALPTLLALLFQLPSVLLQPLLGETQRLIGGRRRGDGAVVVEVVDVVGLAGLVGRGSGDGGGALAFEESLNLLVGVEESVAERAGAGAVRWGAAGHSFVLRSTPRTPFSAGSAVEGACFERRGGVCGDEDIGRYDGWSDNARFAVSLVNEVVKEDGEISGGLASFGWLH